MKRPYLRQIPKPDSLFTKGEVSVTMRTDQWDNFLQGAYEAGCILLEVAEVLGEERIIKAYQMEPEDSTAA